MAGVSTPKLAAAVSNAGGLGSIGLGASTPSAARQAIEELRSFTDKAFNVNLFVHQSKPNDDVVNQAWLDALRPVFRQYDATPPTTLREIYKSFNDDPEMLQVLLDTRPAVVSFHFGLPSESTMLQLKSIGTTLFASATSLAEARIANASPVDAIVAQGYEAGGHRGIFDPEEPDDRLSTMTLTSLLLESCTKPVIAAGGIMNGQGIRSVLELGAIAAQMGTAFVTTDESAADEAYRIAMTSAAGEHTVMTSSISGRPARALSNRFTGLDLTTVRTPAYPYTYDAGKALHAAAKAKGETGYGAQWAGQGAPLARHMGASELVRVLEQELGQEY
ncbi:hypothetical protein CI109_104954 [Kwoniella shandongensis]|uniref:Nitronate monooxygenase domain-containing protein n=1 Tax=Kwoniella shandongensis TaxID=1734106 RepID=A0AAJ8LKR3_9TREE